MSEYLLNKRPILFNPEVAKAIGINEAIVLQQINYWINKPFAKEIGGKRWIYNSVSQWQRDNFPFWSERTIRRILKKLEDDELIISGQFNKAAYDQTKWYTINEEKLEEVMSQDVQTDADKMDTSPVQNDRIRTGQSGRMKPDKMDEPIPETTRDYSENNSIDYLSKEKGQDSHEEKDDLSSKDWRDKKMEDIQAKILTTKIIDYFVGKHTEINNSENNFKPPMVTVKESQKLIPIAKKLIQAKLPIVEIYQKIDISLVKEGVDYYFGYMVSVLDNFAEQELRRQQNES